MKRYLVTKLAWLFATLLFVIVVSFTLTKATGIDPCRLQKATPQYVAQCHARWGLDQPVPVQLGRYLKNLALFDLGDSIQHEGQSINELIVDALPRTLGIVLLSIGLSLVLGTLAGTIAAYWQSTRIDNLIMGIAMVGLAVPEMVVAPILILCFVLTWQLLPRSGLATPASYILPVLALTIIHTADIARLARSGMIDVLRQDYIRTARAKGLRERTIVLRHAIRLGTTAVVSYLGPILANTIAGGVFVVEAMFGIAGLSYLFIDGAMSDPFDLYMVMGSTVMLAALILVMNFLVDIVYAILNPRLRLEVTKGNAGGIIASIRAIGILVVLVISGVMLAKAVVLAVQPISAYADVMTATFHHTTLLLSVAWAGIGVLLMKSYRTTKDRANKSPMTEMWRRLAKNRAAFVSCIVLYAMTFACLFLPWLMEQAFGVTFDSTDLYNTSAAPPFARWLGVREAASWLHLLGTDELGRDLFVRNLVGLRMSLAIGFASLVVAVSIGVLYGTTAAYVGGAVDNVMMRFVDMLYSIPYLVLVILLTKITGRNTLLLFVGIGFVSWLTLSRVTRGEVLKIKHQEFVEAARSVGASSWRIITRHLIPNALGTVIVYATRLMAVIVLSESFLSFLGFGVQEPNASLGILLRDGGKVMEHYWWLTVAPAGTLALLLYALNYLGDGLRDALDPRMRGTR